MTVSGEMTGWKRFSIRLTELLVGLVCGGGIIGIFFLVSRLLELNLWQTLDKDTRMAMVGGSLILGAIGFGLARWFDSDTVVAFTCDGRSFRYRKMGSGKLDSRGLLEVAKVTRGTGHGPVRFRVVFKDRSQCDLLCEDLPNAEVVAEWLGSHLHGA